MKNNIRKIISEDDLTYFLDKNTMKYVVIMFSSKNCEPCQKIKPTFIQLSKENKDVEFIYIDTYDFYENQYFYTRKYDIQYTPYFIFLFNNNKLGVKVGKGKKELIEKFVKYKSKAISILNHSESSPSNDESYIEQHNNQDDDELDDDDEIIKKKLTIISKLCAYRKRGYKVKVNFTVLSNIQDLENELVRAEKEYENMLNEKEKKILAIKKLKLEEKKINDQRKQTLNKLLEYNNDD